VNLLLVSATFLEEQNLAERVDAQIDTTVDSFLQKTRAESPMGIQDLLPKSVLAWLSFGSHFRSVPFAIRKQHPAGNTVFVIKKIEDRNTCFSLLK
jgi:hypothetical protein